MFELDFNKIKPEYRNVSLVSAPLFDENGSDSYVDQMLVGGRPSGIVNVTNIFNSYVMIVFINSVLSTN